MRLFNRFWGDEQGQSQVEYTLLVAVVMFAVMGFAMAYHAGVGGVTGLTNSSLAPAHSVLP
jgi:Flp pilus assembly pilin Flp